MANNLIYNSRLSNENMIFEIYKFLKEELIRLKKNKKSKIFITGFAFKGSPETSDMRSSTTISLLNFLKEIILLMFGDMILKLKIIK